MLKEHISPFDEMEPEKLEIEQMLSSPLDKEPFSEFSSLIYKNVLQPEGETYRRDRDFDTETYFCEKKIKELQQEYEKVIYKINQLNNTLTPIKLKNRDILIEYENIEKELNTISKEIENIENDFSILKSKYREEIKNKEFNLFKKMSIIGGIPSLILMVIPLLINKLHFFIETPIVLISYLIYCSLFGFIHILRRDKYLSKLEKDFIQTEDYQNFKEQIYEKTKMKEQIGQELNLKGKELEESRKEMNEVEYQISIFISNIKRLREELVELILSEFKNIETKYQLGEMLPPEEIEITVNKLVRRLFPQK